VPYWLLKYAPHLILTAGLGLLAVYAVHTFREQGREEIRPQVERLEAELRAERANRIRAEMASSTYASELATLARRPVRSAPVRLCVSPAAVPTRPAAEGVNGAASAAGSSAGSAGENLGAGPDIGPELRELAAQCDIQNAKLRALQQWAQPSP
jgi:hypothetical protein